MKANQHIETVFSHLAKMNLKARDFRVFLAWFKDANGWNATQEIISKRTGLSRTSVSRSLKALVDTGVLQITGMEPAGKYMRNKYALTTRMLYPEGVALDEVLYGNTQNVTPNEQPPPKSEHGMHQTIATVCTYTNKETKEEIDFSTVVRAELDYVIRENPKTFFQEVENYIHGIVIRYGPAIKKSDITTAITRNFNVSSKTRKIGDQLNRKASATYDSALDQYNAAGKQTIHDSAPAPAPTPKPKSDPRIPKKTKEERSEELAKEYYARFPNITDQILKEIEEEERNANQR